MVLLKEDFWFIVTDSRSENELGFSIRVFFWRRQMSWKEILWDKGDLALRLERSNDALTWWMGVVGFGLDDDLLRSRMKGRGVEIPKGAKLGFTVRVFAVPSVYQWEDSGWLGESDLIHSEVHTLFDLNEVKNRIRSYGIDPQDLLPVSQTEYPI